MNQSTLMMKALRTLVVILAGGTLLAAPARAALLPAGPEVLLAADPDLPLHTPIVAADSRGRSLICWQKHLWVDCGLFDRKLQPLRAPATVNPEHLAIDFPPVSASNGSQFVAGWTSPAAAVYGRAVDAQGRLAPSERLLSQGDGLYRVDPFFAAGPDLSFLGVWTGQVDPYGETAIYARRFRAPLGPLGPELLLQPVPFPSGDPTVAFGEDGGFLLVWAAGASASGIFTRHFDASGVPAGPVVRLDQSPMHETSFPSVAFHAGRFLVAWQGTDVAGESSIRARMVSGAGASLGPERLVAQTQTGFQQLPKVAADRKTGFVVIWEGLAAADPSDAGVLARCFDRRGRPLSGDRLVNATVEGIQYRPSIAALGGGQFAVAWEDVQFDTNQTTIRGRKIRCQR